jgi:MoxR-like ATPase
LKNDALPAERPANDRAQQQVAALLENIESVFFGKKEVIKLCIAGLLGQGHVLIEDVPGIGKTTLAQALAHSLDSSFSRIQFTSDLLPSDIIGVSILDPKTNSFEFRAGPIFASIVLADEINRTPPKTQSALLEAMSEAHVTSDGKTRALPRPFMVLATQNPIEYEGTYMLPEAQLDRFLLRVEIGYPDGEAELRIMRRPEGTAALDRVKPVLTAEEIVGLQDYTRAVHVDDTVSEYMLAIVHATRAHDHIQLGASPRGSLALYEACQAMAVVEGRDFVTPGDVKRMAAPVMSHRILIKSRGGNPAASALERNRIIDEIVNAIPVPV